MPPIDYTKEKVPEDSAAAVTGLGLDLQTVVNTLQNEVGSVSSSDETIDSSIGAAIAGQKEAAAANQQRVESQFGRESQYLSESLRAQRSGMLSQTRGGAVGFQALTMIDKEIEKSMRDLDMRKNELILQGNAAAASKISDLQVQQMTLKVDAQQRHFTNLLGLGQFQASVLQQQQQVKNDARRMSIDELKLDIERRQQDTYEKKTEADITNDSARIAIQRSELKIQQAREQRESKLDNIAADPGWASSAVQVKVMGEVATQLYAISTQLASGAISEDEARAQKALLYAKQRGIYSRGAVTDEALTEAIFGPASVEQQYEEELAQLNIPGSYGGSSAAAMTGGGFFDSLFSDRQSDSGGISSSSYRQLKESGFKFK